MGVLTGCKPRQEVLKGDLDDAIFAADFGHLIMGKAPKVYGDPTTFFKNTHPAKQLSKIVGAVFGRLANSKEGGAAIRLSTGYGGGKTHTLMALWHMARNIGDPSLGTDLLPAAGRPKQVKEIALDASRAGVPVFARHGKIEVKSLWGEIAYQLGEEKAWRMLGPADDPERQPDETLIEKMFPSGPILILLDELVVYMATLSDRGQGNMLAYLKKLASLVSNRPQTVLVVTDPAVQRAYAREASRIGDNLIQAAVKLDDEFGRKMTDFDPIGDESAQVIIRRLFEKVDPTSSQLASADYHGLYERVAQEFPGLIPPLAAGNDYSRKIVACYPFHPRLLETAQGRLGALQEFHKSRGTLRLFARILRTVWEAKEDLELISAGDVNWSSSRIQNDLLYRLNRDNFKSAITSDIENHAHELDGSSERGIHVRTVSALLLESIPMQSNSGFDPAELTLAVLRPDEAGPEPSEALDHLVGICWHTYPMAGGRGWQFRYEPNIIKQIEEGVGQIPPEDAKSLVLSEAQGYFSGSIFKTSPWPTSSRQVSESSELQLVLCEEERMAKTVCAYADDSDPKAPIPRRFQNAILAIAPTSSSFNAALEKAQRLLSAEAIERQHKSGETNKLVREQLRRIMPELQKQFRIQTCRAFDRVIFAGGSSYPLDEQFQVPEDQMLQRPQGQSSLRRFLESKGLIYQPGDALDVARFLKDILPGATPIPEKPDVYTAKAIHERFLSAPGLRLLLDGGVVRQTVLKAVTEGKIVVCLADGRSFDARGCVEGSEGKRRRISGNLTSLPLDDSVLITRTNSSSGLDWLKEDKAGLKVKNGGPPPPPSPSTATRVNATTWEKAVELAKDRPLVQLNILATNPNAAANLISLVQPLGAESLSLSVTVGGKLKEGGNINFAANDLKPNHPTKPLSIAQTLFNALGEGIIYESDISLNFGQVGRAGLEDQIKDLAENVPEGVMPRAIFEKSIKDAR